MKYSKELTEKITDALTQGRGRVQGCKAAGIHYSTFLDWFNNKPEFTEAIKKAEDEGNMKMRETCITSIMTAVASGTWQAAAWFLERRFPQEFARQPLVKNEVHLPEPTIKIEVTRPEYAAELQKLIDGVDDWQPAKEQEPEPAKTLKIGCIDNEHAEIMAAICSDLSGQPVNFVPVKNEVEPPIQAAIPFTPEQPNPTPPQPQLFGKPYKPRCNRI